MKNPFKRKPQASSCDQAAPPTPEQLAERALRRLAEARNKEAEQLNRSTKWRGRITVLVTVVAAILAAFELTNLGYDFAKHHYAVAFADGLLAVMFSGMLLFTALDNYIDGKMGRELHTTVREAIEKADKAEETQKAKAALDEALDELKDTLINDINIEDAHKDMPSFALETVISEVLKEGAKGAEHYEPTDADAREIERRFHKLTNHTVEIESINKDWHATIDDLHTDAQPAKTPTKSVPKPVAKKTNQKKEGKK